MDMRVSTLLRACLLVGLAACGNGGNHPMATPTAVATAVPSATPTPPATPDPRAAACASAGGSVTRGLCCAGSGDFPNACGIGACGCAPASSREVARCLCPDGSCWNGSTCEARAAD